MWKHKTPGIPDEYFDRTDEVPITKEEARVIQISKGRLCEGQVVYEIGCGSGSSSVESAFRIGALGKVFAIVFGPKAGELTKKYLEKFGLPNVNVILGNALEKISDLPQADVIFIGGTGGETAEILKICEGKLNAGGRMVIGTILIETLYSVLSTIEKLQFSSVDITQVTISKSRKTSTGTMMLARNPVTIISAQKSNL